MQTISVATLHELHTAFYTLRIHVQFWCHDIKCRRLFKIFSRWHHILFSKSRWTYINSRTGILFPGCYMHAQWQNSQWVKMTLAVFPGISPCNSHTWLDMGLKRLACARPQNIIKVIKYFSYWVNWSDVARSQSSAMGQNDPYRPSSVNKRITVIRPPSCQKTFLHSQPQKLLAAMKFF